ncbi:MAG: sigma-70 family RNA polymerase sigma factor [Saprospiraceae bacterium]|nr:sigma-70 family RNA polymerase sigma factor [Saprospiraceae bacterium]
MKIESVIWNRLRAGEESALKEIYEEYFDSLINYGLRMSPHTELVEDSVQELFIEIWRLHQNLSPTDNIKNYLICSFRRKLIKKLKSRPVSQSEEILSQEVDTDSNFINQLIDNEESIDLQNRISKAMESLSSRQKEAIYLKFHEGLEYEEICESMELKYQSVRNLISTGILRLREYLSMISLFYIGNEYITVTKYFNY